MEPPTKVIEELPKEFPKEPKGKFYQFKNNFNKDVFDEDIVEEYSGKIKILF